MSEPVLEPGDRLDLTAVAEAGAVEAADTFVEAENTAAEAAGIARRCSAEVLAAVVRTKEPVGMLAAVAVDRACYRAVAGLAEVVALVVAAGFGSVELRLPICSCRPARVTAMPGRRRSSVAALAVG